MASPRVTASCHGISTGNRLLYLLTESFLGGIRVEAPAVTGGAETAA